MKEMCKKLLVLLLAATMIVTMLAACSKSSNDSGKSEEKTSEAEAEGSSSEEAAPAEEAFKYALPEDFGPDAPAGETDDRAFYKFETPVDVHIGMSVDPTDTTLSDLGDTVEENYFIRYIRDTFNINVIVDWYAASGDAYNQKVSTLIASNDLPDALVTGERTYLVAAARDGQLQDIGDAINKYSSQQVLKIENSAGEVAINKSSYQGKVYSIPSLDVSASEVPVMFIREDWCDELGLEIPKTVEDLEKVAKAFVESGKAPYGIQGPQNNTRTYCTFMSANPAMGMLDPVYQAMGAYPGYLLQDDSGKVYYGSTTEEFKSALELLHRWYEEGILNPEMCVQTEVGKDINGNVCGIYMCSWWALGYGNTSSFINDPTANWQAYPLYNANGEWEYHVGNLGNGYTLIKNGVSEDVQRAIVELNNIHVRDEAFLVDNTYLSMGYFPLRNNQACADESEYTHKVLLDIALGKTTEADYDFNGNPYKHLKEDIADIQRICNNMDWAKDDHLTPMDLDVNDPKFSRIYSLMVGDRPYTNVEPVKKVSSVTYSPTAAVEKYWSNLIAMEDEFVLQVITGKKDISEFDTFVEDWLNQGGQEILDEVQAELG